MNARARRLADFQHGRAPELATLAARQAAEARAAALARRRQAGAERAARIEAEAIQAHADAQVAEAVAVLAAAFGPGRRAVCPSCKRAMNSGCRACGNCGWRDPDAIRHWRAA